MPAIERRNRAGEPADQYSSWDFSMRARKNLLDEEHGEKRHACLPPSASASLRESPRGAQESKSPATKLKNLKHCTMTFFLTCRYASHSTTTTKRGRKKEKGKVGFYKLAS